MCVRVCACCLTSTSTALTCACVCVCVCVLFVPFTIYLVFVHIYGALALFRWHFLSGSVGVTQEAVNTGAFFLSLCLAPPSAYGACLHSYR